MKKPNQLREYLIKLNPSLATNPEQLLIFADDGAVIEVDGGSLAFAYNYTLNLIIIDWRGSVNDLVVPILAWRHIYEPPTAQTQDGDFNVNVDYLGAGASDIHIKLKLSERVLVNTDKNGFKVKYLNDTCPPELITDWAAALAQNI